MTDLQRIGLFKEMSYHTINDPYKDPKYPVDDSRGKGRNICAAGRKTKSALSDCYFGKFSRVFEGDCQYDLSRTVKKHRQQAKKLILGKDWLPGDCLKPLSSVGSHYGTFRGRVDHFSGLTVPQSKVQEHLKNIITSATKKGSGSYVNITFNPYPKHSPDPYDLPTNKDSRTADTAKGAFYCQVHKTACFDENPYRNTSRGGKQSSLKEHVAHKSLLPFKPPGQSKSIGGCKAGCFSPYPAYQSNATKSTKSAPTKHHPAFHISLHGNPYPTPSVVATNINRSVNANNCTQVNNVVYGNLHF